jgi:hypothetical protein
MVEEESAAPGWSVPEKVEKEFKELFGKVVTLNSTFCNKQKLLEQLDIRHQSWPAVVSINENNNFKVMIDNCASYDVTIERNDLMGLIPLTDETAGEICAAIKKKIPKIRRAWLSRDKIARCCNL